MGGIIDTAHSFFFSVNTNIYLLLRKRVDSTDIEDVYVDEDITDLLAEQDNNEPDTAEPSDQPQTPPTEAETPPAETEPEPEKPADEESRCNSRDPSLRVGLVGAQ